MLGLSAGLLLDCQGLPTPWDLRSNAAPDLDLLAEAWNTIQQTYVDRTALKSRDLTYGAISGMVDALGDTGHSRFLTPEARRLEHDLARGEFQGIGAEVRMEDSQVVIVAPIDNSPAQRAGLRPGDVILKIDGQDTTGLSLDEVVSRILGPAGTRVTLTLLSPATRRTQDITLVRASVTIRNVTWERLPGTRTAHLRIAGFSRGVLRDLRQALEEVERQGLNAVILDLRNNPGGLLTEAVGVTSQFLKDGSVLLQRDARGRITPVPVQPGGLATDIPLVVLVNGGTASGAEIVAGAVKDAGRAPLVGDQTIGTGTVLAEFPLSDGSALLLAIEEWLTPKGHVIWHKGITPDVAVSLAPEATPVFPRTVRGMTAAQLRERGDEQLLRALDLLSRPSQQMVSGTKAALDVSAR
jgi:carboxyl-terminal processing protease